MTAEERTKLTESLDRFIEMGSELLTVWDNCVESIAKQCQAEAIEILKLRHYGGHNAS